jgi:mRNA interferase HicA
VFTRVNTSVILFSNKSKELKRWLASKVATFASGKGGNLKVYLNGKQSVLPVHSGELKTGLVEASKEQLGFEGPGLGREPHVRSFRVPCGTREGA